MLSSGRRKPALVALSHMQLDKASEHTLRRSLYTCVRDAIVSGAIKAGTRLPSTRQLAEQLEISRNTVFDVFAQLTAEGMLVARRGSGTFVAVVEVVTGENGEQRTAWERASARGRLLASRASHDELRSVTPLPFAAGIPAFEHFPFDVWARIAARILRNPKPGLLGYGPSEGYTPLREAIAAGVRARGGRACSEEQVIVVGGTSQALDLIARLTLDPGDDVWIEDPSSLYVRTTLVGAGATLVPVPVDAEGIDVAAGVARSRRSRLAYVTSARQWPLGATLSAQRRTELLAWADGAEGWIVEDEYDGVFRYDGTKPRTLRAMDQSDRVIAVGSFSITTFPGLRLGYIIAPRSLAGAFSAAKATVDRQSSVLEQAILAEFIYDGHYAKYRTSMESVYATRAQLLVDAIAASGGPAIAPPEAGLHLVLPLAGDVDDRAVALAARSAGIVTLPLSAHYLERPARTGLILGFGAGSTAAIEMSASRLCRDVLQVPRERRLARLSVDLPG